jgi:tetratricopeptide (TPR) repeat protein
LSKSAPKATKESGTYHYVTGVDSSSSASVAAYLNTLTFSLGESQLWFGKHPLWKVHSGIYCCYNAFSRIDVRVLVQIPGSVESYVIDEFGDKRRANSDQMWLETYLSAVLRALLFADSDTFYINCCRRLDPLTTPENASKFFDATKKLFLLGPRLGAVSEVQVPSITSNYLVDGFLKFVEITGMYDEALDVLESIVESEPEVVSLICKVLLMNNQEVKAIERLHSAILANPRDAFLLELESKFCQDKKRLDLALDCAIRAVNGSPSEFLTWARLAEVYIKKGNYEQALLTLNSCPMFTFHEMDVHRMPPPLKVHYPLPTDGAIDEIWSVDVNSDTDVSDPGLLRLHAPTLRATFAKAYDLLTEIVARIGWDALLKYRSNVFVMEVEYRKDRKRTDSPSSSEDAANGNENRDGNLAKPETAQAPADVPTAPSSINGVNGSSTSVDELRNKRLCERWLDNLFMVLYDDLRVYTVWRTEFVHCQSQQLPYDKTALEWEILGMVAHRLKHQEEAIDAFRRSLDAKFSHRVLWKLLDYYVPEKGPINSQEGLDTVVRLTAWNHRWYTEFAPKLFIALQKIVSSEGLVKVRSSIDAKYSPQGIVELMAGSLNKLERFHIPGTEY